MGAFAFVQVSDAVAGSVTTPDRAVPGDGDIPLESLLGRILEAGYQGAFDLEVIGPRIEQEGYASAIGRGRGMGVGSAQPPRRLSSATWPGRPGRAKLVA